MTVGRQLFFVIEDQKNLIDSQNCFNGYDLNLKICVLRIKKKCKSKPWVSNHVESKIMFDQSAIYKATLEMNF